MDDNDLREIKARLVSLEVELRNQKEDADEREKKQLMWGIRVLGSVVALLGAWVWTQIGHLFDLGKP